MQRLHECRRISSAEYAQLTAQLDWATAADKQPPVFCHGDLHQGNLLMAGGRLVVLDWEQGVRPRADVTSASSSDDTARLSV